KEAGFVESEGSPFEKKRSEVPRMSPETFKVRQVLNAQSPFSEDEFVESVSDEIHVNNVREQMGAVGHAKDHIHHRASSRASSVDSRLALVTTKLSENRTPTVIKSVYFSGAVIFIAALVSTI